MPDVSRYLVADQVLDGRYRLRHLIARGGMAEVWEAVDDVLGRPVAVKVLLPHLAADQSFLDRFRREAIAAARLGHPHVVATYDTGLDDGVAYIVMELVDGPTLRQLLVAESLRPERVVDICGQVADALHYAHQAGIIHRDVKPATILVCPGDQVKVADFGIAKAVLEDGGADRDLTQTGTILGTAKYFSPEQVEGRPLDGRADVYALGVVMYEMLCGRPLFTGETEMAVGVQHVSRVPVSPRQVKAGIPRPVEAIVLKALAKSPDDRFPTAAAFRNALLSVDLRADDAVPLVERDDTPPAGVLAPVPLRRRRRWLPPVVATAVLASVLILVIVLLARGDGTPPTSQPSPRAGPVEVAGLEAFDPGGDGAEHDDELRFLTDGDPSTSWTTQQYASRSFGNLKPGVGFVIRLDSARRLGRLSVSSPNRGWTAEVSVAPSPRSSRESWGPSVDRQADIDGGATFDLGGASGSAVLVWITDLGTTNSVTLGDLELLPA
ncbi:MAG: protein kinase domain-containing protein [Acidimicrobiales bacterium]